VDEQPTADHVRAPAVVHAMGIHAALQTGPLLVVPPVLRRR
jgi:hypothetical protein